MKDDRHLGSLGRPDPRAVTQQRVYRPAPLALDEVESWCREVRSFWERRLDAIDSEIARGRQDRQEERP